MPGYFVGRLWKFQMSPGMTLVGWIISKENFKRFVDAQ